MNASEHQSWAEEMSADCRLCPRQCRVDRAAGETGWCGVDANARVYDDFIHWGEEAGLAPSYTVFLLGCNLECRYCYTADERCGCRGERLDAASFAEMTGDASDRGARNLNFIGGEPTVMAPAILELLAEVDPALPLVWNTNGYASPGVFEMINDVVDTWLVDLKVGNPNCGAEVIGAADYWDVCRDRLGEIFARTPERLIVRHLVMPGHVECCARPALEWIASALPEARVNILLNYTPMPCARDDDRLGRFLSPEERHRAIEIATELSLPLVAGSGGRVDGAALDFVEAREHESKRRRRADTEIVISPHGEVHVRQPTAQVMETVVSAVRGEST